MKSITPTLFLLSATILLSCSRESEGLRIYQTSQAGDKLVDKGRVSAVETRDPERATLVIHPERQYQQITGFGGAFTESSAYVLGQLSKAKRAEVIRRYFSPDGASYSLTRTHINSCDFSLKPYSYDAASRKTWMISSPLFRMR
jgi:glucosylceramidase